MVHNMHVARATVALQRENKSVDVLLLVCPEMFDPFQHSAAISSGKKIILQFARGERRHPY